MIISKRSRSPVIIMAIVLVGVLLLAMALAVSQGRRSKISSDRNIMIASAHGKISIDGNANLDGYCSGNSTDGLTLLTAHVMLHLDIDAKGAIAGIEIKNTNRFLILQGCIIENAGQAGDGIRLINCSNVRIFGCLVHNNTNGILLKDSVNVTIYDSNTTGNAMHGIYLQDSSKNVLMFNNITRNGGHGIFLSGANHNEILRNKFKENTGGCIYIENSSHNSITDNVCDAPATPGFDPAVIASITIGGIVIVVIMTCRSKHPIIESLGNKISSSRGL